MDCLIHMGLEKTGTTLLQNWLYSNRTVLEHSGIYLSESIGKANNRDFVSYFQLELDDWAWDKGIVTEEKKKTFFEGFEDRFAQEVESASKTHDLMIITSEHFHSRLRTREELEAVHRFLIPLFNSIRVVGYFRDQGDMALSLYSTGLRSGGTKSFEDFRGSVVPESYYWNFDEISKNWIQVFGPSNCDFAIYDRDRFVGKDLRLDFLMRLGKDVSVEALDMTVSSANESLSPLQAALIRAVNAAVPYWRPGNEGVNPDNLALRQLVMSVESLAGGKMVARDLEEVSKRFQASNQAFFDRHFNGEYEFSRRHRSVLPDQAIFSSDECAAILCDFLEACIRKGIPPSVGRESISRTQMDAVQTRANRLQKQLWYRSSVWRRIVFRPGGKPRKWAAALLLNRKSKEPRALFRSIVYEDGTVRPIFAKWLNGIARKGQAN